MERLRSTRELVDLLGAWAVSSGPLYRQLGDVLRDAVHRGDLQAGERLPSERELSRALAVSRATVMAAYDQLRAEGLLESVRGSGTRIAVRPGGPSTTGDGRVQGGQGTAIFQRLVDGPGGLISLTMATQPAVSQLSTALRDLVDDQLPDLLLDSGYHPQGYPPLREAIAAHLSAGGLRTNADQVLVTAGAQQALGLVTQMYLRPRSHVIVERPSWPGCIDVFRSVQARLIGIDLDRNGIDVVSLAAALSARQPALVYVMPTYHNPTGLLMSKAVRRRVAELITLFSVPLVEDNADAGSEHPNDAPPPIAAFAPPDAPVLTVGSLTKAVWGGLRIGWIRGPRELIDRLARYRVRSDLGSPLLDQALAARLIPALPEIVASRYAVLSERRDLLSRLLRERLPDWRWREPDGGSALWVELPGTDAAVFAQVALRHGVEMVPGASTDPSGGHDSFTRIPFTFPAATIEELVARLADAWSEQYRTS